MTVANISVCMYGHVVVDIDECSSNPCQNRANCSMPTLGVYTCQCVAGYTGINCEAGIYGITNVCYT